MAHRREHARRRPTNPFRRAAGISGWPPSAAFARVAWFTRTRADAPTAHLKMTFIGRGRAVSSFHGHPFWPPTSTSRWPPTPRSHTSTLAPRAYRARAAVSRRLPRRSERRLEPPRSFTTTSRIWGLPVARRWSSSGIVATTQSSISFARPDTRNVKGAPPVVASRASTARSRRSRSHLDADSIFGKKSVRGAARAARTRRDGQVRRADGQPESAPARRLESARTTIDPPDDHAGRSL